MTSGMRRFSSLPCTSFRRLQRSFWLRPLLLCSAWSLVFAGVRDTRIHGVRVHGLEYTLFCIDATVILYNVIRGIFHN